MKLPDKTTGRGCARSIAARRLANELIADGVLNQPIARRHLKDGNDVVFRFDPFERYDRVGTKWLENRPADEPLWVPTIVAPDIWAAAAGDFLPRHNLKENVECFLLPRMEEYFSAMSEEDVIAMIREFLLSFGVVNSPIRQIHGDSYYFNEEEIYTLDKGSQLFPYEGKLKFHLFEVKDHYSFNMTVWAKAVKQFEFGMSLTDCIKIFLNTQLRQEPREELSYIDRLIQYVHSPEYERVPENTNENTFDRIRVVVGLPQSMFQSWDELKTAIRENRKEIDRRVLQKIADDRRFKKFGVTTNVIRLSEVLLRKNYSLEYIFELKEH